MGFERFEVTDNISVAIGHRLILVESVIFVNTVIDLIKMQFFMRTHEKKTQCTASKI